MPNNSKKYVSRKKKSKQKVSLVPSESPMQLLATLPTFAISGTKVLTPHTVLGVVKSSKGKDNNPSLVAQEQDSIFDAQSYIRLISKHKHNESQQEGRNLSIKKRLLRTQSVHVPEQVPRLEVSASDLGSDQDEV